LGPFPLDPSILILNAACSQSTSFQKAHWEGGRVGAQFCLAQQIILFLLGITFILVLIRFLDFGEFFGFFCGRFSVCSRGPGCRRLCCCHEFLSNEGRRWAISLSARELKRRRGELRQQPRRLWNRGHSDGDGVEKQGMLQKNFQRGAESDGPIQNAPTSQRISGSLDRKLQPKIPRTAE